MKLMQWTLFRHSEFLRQFSLDRMYFRNVLIDVENFGVKKCSQEPIDVNCAYFSPFDWVRNLFMIYNQMGVLKVSLRLNDFSVRLNSIIIWSRSSFEDFGANWFKSKKGLNWRYDFLCWLISEIHFESGHERQRFRSYEIQDSQWTEIAK